MPRYIDKEKVIERINYLCEVCSEPPMDKADEIKLKLLRELENEFNKLPTADVQEVKHDLFGSEIKAKVVKEFAERLKEKSGKMEMVCSGALVQRDYTISEEILDNLVKEMVGEE